MIKKGRQRLFTLDDLEMVEVRHRRLLFPLIIGGILTPLSLLAIKTNNFQPFIILLVLFLGLFLLQLGWIGSDALILKLHKNREETLFFKKIPKNVEKFITYMNSALINKSFKSINLLVRKDHLQGSPVQLFIDTETDKRNNPDYVRVNPLLLTHPIIVNGPPGENQSYFVHKINSEALTTDITY